MLNTQILKLFRSFQPEEFEDFNDFVRSPYFNKSKSLTGLWDAIKKYSPEYNSENLKKEAIFAVVFKDREYKDGTMRNLISSMNNLIEKFLEIRFHEMDKFQCNYNTLIYCLIKNYPELFQKNYKKILADYDDKSEGQDYHYLNKYMIQRLGSAFGNLTGKISTGIYAQGESLICFFLIHFFQAQFNAAVLKIRRNEEIKETAMKDFRESFDMENFLEKFKNKNDIDYKILSLYYYMLLSFEDSEDTEIFNKFKKSFYETTGLIQKHEQENALSSILNTSVNRINMGINGAYREYTEIQRFRIKNDFNLKVTNDKINTAKLINMIKNLFEAGENELVTSEYLQYKDALIEEEKESIDNFFNAFKCFSEKDYNTSLSYSSKFRPKIEIHKIYLKLLQLKCYYELNESEAFDYTLDSCRQILYRNDAFSEELKTYNKNFVTSLNNLFQYKLFPKGNFDDIKFEILNNKMVGKDWLIEKMEELESKIKK